MKFEFLIPASPQPAFFSQIAMFRRALDHLGGDYAAARLVAVFGDADIHEVSADWVPFLDRVEVHWVTPEAFAERGYFAQGNRRFELISPDADLAVICDADILPMRPFDDELLRFVGKKAVAGVIAHYHFPWARRTGDAAGDWQKVAGEVLGHPIALEHRYTLADPAPIETPFYINFGVVAGTPSGLAAVWQDMSRIERQVEAVMGNYFSAQVAFALAVAASGVTTHALPMRYNFPNDQTAETAYVGELESIILLHYLRGDLFDRQKVFATEAAFKDFLGMDLTGANAALQDHVRLITGGAYPFARPGRQPAPMSPPTGWLRSLLARIARVGA